MIRPMTSNVSALAGIVANGHLGLLGTVFELMSPLSLQHSVERISPEDGHREYHRS